MVISVQCSSDNLVTCINDGMWPSGKAPGFGPGIRGFESLHPSHRKTQTFRLGFSMAPLYAEIRTYFE